MQNNTKMIPKSATMMMKGAWPNPTHIMEKEIMLNPTIMIRILTTNIMMKETKLNRTYMTHQVLLQQIHINKANEVYSQETLLSLMKKMTTDGNHEVNN